MASKLFFKHLFLSIRKRPLQPFLLTLVIFFAVAVCISILNVQTNITYELDYSNNLAYGESDFVVQPNALSESRFIMINEARRNLQGKADVCGVLSTPMFVGNDEDFLYGAVSEFSEIGCLFPLYLLDEAYMTDENLDSSCIISQETADTYHLAVGDTITVSLFDLEAEYVVCGITQYPIQNTYGILVDISSFTKILLSQSDYAVYAAIIDNDIPLSSNLYVKTHGNDDEVYDILTSLYPDMTIHTGEDLRTEMYSMQEFFIMMILASLVFVVLVIYCCCHIISVQRTEETFLFSCVGARPRSLNAVSMAEIALYWLIGSIGGIFLSYPLNSFMISYCRLEHCQPAFYWDSILISVFSILLAAEMSLLLFILLSEIKKRKIRKKKTVTKKANLSRILWFVFGILTLGLLLVTVFLPVSTPKWLVGVGSFLGLAFFLFLSGKEGCKVFPKLLLKNKKLKPFSVYAYKNARNVETLSNTSAIFTLFCTVIFVIVYLIIGTSSTLNLGWNFLQGDYFIANSTVEVSALQETEGVKDVYNVLQETLPFLEDEIRLIGTDNKAAFSEHLGFEELPQGNEAYIGAPIVNRYHLKEGDEFELTVGNRTFTFVYARPLELNAYLIFINPDYYDIPYAYQVVDGEEGFDQKVLYENIMTTLSLSTATVIKTTDLQKQIRFNSYYINCGYFILIFITIFSFIGMADNILSSYRSRREEFYSYSIAGMSKTYLRKMKAIEILYAFIVGFLVFVFLLGWILATMYECALGFTMNIFWLFV